MDFEFLQNKINGKWVISATNRSHRTNVGKATDICPFCPGQEVEEEELYRVPSVVSSQVSGATSDHRPQKFDNQDTSNWSVRVIKNKFPFAPNHEVIIHSPDHHKNWDELPFSQVEFILQTYRQRYNAHKNPSALLRAGDQVYIFHNRGRAAGESLPHPHTQLVVIPQNVKLDIPPLNPGIYKKESVVSSPRGEAGAQLSEVNFLETEHFLVFCPTTSEWPDEVWLAPKQNGGGFGFIKDSEITDLSFVLSRLIQIFDLRHGHEFPFNFYIPPLKNWYLRLIPRTKIIGGFELGTNIIVNTQDPAETLRFINEHFWEPDKEKIQSEHLAGYREKV